MNKIFGHKRSILAKLAYTASYGAHFSFSSGLLIEFFSSLQIISLILGTSFPVSKHYQTLVFHSIQGVTSFLGFFSSLAELQTENNTLLVWVAYSVYLLLYSTLIMVVLGLHKIGTKINPAMQKMCTQTSIIHSKMLFCPICYFYLKFIYKNYDLTTNSNMPAAYKTALVILTIVFLMINLLVAGMKEAFFYQTYKNDSPFAVKCNLHAKIQLIHKAILLPLVVFMDEYAIAGSILNVGFTFLYHLLLFLRLPFFNITCLKMAIFLSTVSVTSSFILLWKVVSDSPHRTFEFLVIVFIPITLKFMLMTLNRIFDNILMLKCRSPFHIIHLPLLLREHFSSYNKPHSSSLLRVKVLMNTIGIDEPEISSPTLLKEYDSKVYTFIVGELIKTHQRNPQSAIVVLCLIQIFIEKVKNVSYTLMFIQKAKDLPLSVAELNTLVYLRTQLQLKLAKPYPDRQLLEYTRYFINKDISTKIKQDIQNEVNLHLEFWKCLCKDQVDFYHAVHASARLDLLSSSIHKVWDKHEKEFKKLFPGFAIMYGIYLSIIRGTPHLGQPLLGAMYKHAKLVRSMERWIKHEKAVVIISNQRENLGKILHASQSVQDFFNIDKADLIGKTINMLMPSIIQQKHDGFIQKYNEKSGFDSDFGLSVYCKTIDGNFFHSSLSVRVYPEIDREIGLIGVFSNKEDYESVFFVDVDGNILDCSQDLLSNLGIEPYAGKGVKLQEIAPAFEAVNKAFNTIHGFNSQPTPISPIYEVEEYSLEVPLNDSKSKQGSGEDIQKPFLLCSDSLSLVHDQTLSVVTGRLDSGAMRKNSNNFQKKSEFPSFSIFRRQRMAPKDEEVSSNQESSSPLSPLSGSLMKTMSSPKSNKLLSLQDEIVMKTENDFESYKKIMEGFTQGRVISFYPNKTDSDDASMQYFVKVGPLILEKQLYKIVKVKRIQHKKKEHELGHLSLKSPRVIKKYDGSPVQGGDVPIVHLTEQQPIRDQVKRESVKNGSVKEGSQQINTRIERTFANLYAKERPGTFTKFYFFLFYFGVLLIIGLTTQGLLLMRESFKQIELGAKLMEVDSERIQNLMNIWKNANLLYTSLIYDINLPEKDVVSQMIIEKSLSVSELNNEIISLLTQVNSDNIVSDFLELGFSLWGEYNGHHDDSLLFSSITGIVYVMRPIVSLVNTTRDLLLINPEPAIFSLNNSVNGLLLSIESDMQTIQQVKTDIYNDNMSLISIFLIVQDGSVILVLLSLVIIVIRAHKSHKRLFRMLSTIPLHRVKTRTQQLLQFNQCIRENFESVTFIQKLDSFYERNTKAKEEHVKTKMIDFKEQDRYFITRFKTNDVFLLLFALLMLLLIICLLSFSNGLSFRDIKGLKRISEISRIAEVMGYQTDLLSGNLLYWMQFYNDTTMLLREKSKEAQLDKNMEIQLNVNSELTEVFSYHKDEYSDPIIDDLLFKDVCSFIEKDRFSQEMCENATHNDNLGLLELNIHYHNTYSHFIEEFRLNPSTSAHKRIFKMYVSDGLPLCITLRNTYNFLKKHLFESLKSDVDEHNTKRTAIFIVICITCLSVAFILRVFVLKRLLMFEKERYKVLKIVPLSLLMENRMIVSYLKNEFADELAEIKSIL